MSIDNAAVLGAMVSQLPNDKPIPWPSWMRPFSARIDRTFGMQRDAALKVGLLGAYLGRALMLLLASIVVQNLWLRVIGALYLLKLALGELGEMGHKHDKARSANLAGNASNFWGVVVAVELADLAFSLDNVVAAVALSDELWVVLLGVGIGIVTMRFAATIFTRLISWEPALEVAAYLLVLAISIELLLDTLFHIHLGEIAQFSISFLIILLTILVARWRPLQAVQPVLRPLLVVCSWGNSAFNLLLWPFTVLLRRSRQALPNQEA